MFSSFIFDSPQALIAAVVALFAIPRVYLKFQGENLRLNLSKERSLFLLLEKNPELDGSSLKLQLALRRTFGKTVSDQDYFFAIKRFNPLGHLQKRLMAGSLIKLNREGTAYIDARKNAFFSLSKASVWSSIAAAVMLFPLVFFVFSSWVENYIVGLIALIETVAIEWFLLIFSRDAEVAARLLSIDDLYPIREND